MLGLATRLRRNNGFARDDKRALEENPIKSSRCPAKREDDEKQHDKRAAQPRHRPIIQAAAKLCKYSAMAKLVWLTLIAFVAASLLDANLIVYGQQEQQKIQPLAQVQPRTVAKHRRPDSSSSMFADVEDMNDSTIKTRLGKITIEHLGDSPHDFDQLIERIVPGELEIASKIPLQEVHDNALQQQQQTKISADVNNKTTMRFFRNSRTFGSIVYTNPFQDNKRRPRRLINCHLVDLEKHSSDVALYEAKYDIHTIDVDFKEMMQIIEACTNIARFRRRSTGGSHSNSHFQQQLPVGMNQQQQKQKLLTGDQLLAAPNSPVEALASSKIASNVGGSKNNQNSGLRPTIVVGRPETTGFAPATESNQPAQALSTYQKVMSSHLNQELQSIGSPVDDSSKLDLPMTSFDELHNHPNVGSNTNPNNKHSHQHQMHRHVKRGYSSSGLEANRRRFDPMQTPQSITAALTYFNSKNRSSYKDRYKQPQVKEEPEKNQMSADRAVVNQNETDVSDALTARYQSTMRALKRQFNNMPLVKTINRVNVATKKLVLGEVTAPPDMGMSRKGLGSSSGSVRDAIQEISSYDTSDLLSIWRGILPGTNWCGMGDRATSYNDLGFESDIDICCRAHDFCPIRLSAFTSGYGLFNWSFYTRSHCWCDQNFLDCLQQAESPLSSVVMKFYFSIMKTTCLTDSETTAGGQLEQTTPQNGDKDSEAASANLFGNLRQRSTTKSGLFGAIGSHRNQLQQQRAGSPNGGSYYNTLGQPGAGKYSSHYLQQQQSQSHLAIPALKHSQAYQSKLDGHKPQQKVN